MWKSEVSKETLKPFQADSPTNAILEVEFSFLIKSIIYHLLSLDSKYSWQVGGVSKTHSLQMRSKVKLDHLPQVVGKNCKKNNETTTIA